MPATYIALTAGYEAVRMGIASRLSAVSGTPRSGKILCAMPRFAQVPASLSSTPRHEICSCDGVHVPHFALGQGLGDPVHGLKGLVVPASPSSSPCHKIHFSDTRKTAPSPANARHTISEGRTSGAERASPCIRITPAQAWCSPYSSHSHVISLILMKQESESIASQYETHRQ